MNDPIALSAAQCRAARALLNWSQEQLAENAQVARATLADFEREGRAPMRQNLLAIAAALEAAGVALIPEDGEGAGVRFRKRPLEYSNTVSPDGDGVSLSVRYQGEVYRALISREILDDLDHTTYRTFEERVEAVQRHLPLVLQTVEAKLAAGAGGRLRRLALAHTDFPAGAF